jgi:YYY domain-containing protein
MSEGMRLRSQTGRDLVQAASLYAVEVLFVALLVAGAWLRFNNLDWDAGSHIHPDERFLTMVGTGIALPKDLLQYFSTPSSPMNPYNRGFNTFVYGTMPLFVVKVVGEALGLGDYDHIHLVGRALSALFDLGTVVFTFLLGRRLFGPWVGLGAAALIVFVPLHVQNAHFFTVDSFSVTFATGCLYFLVRSVQRQRLSEWALAGSMLGMAAASKLNSLLLLGPLFLAGYYALSKQGYRQVARGIFVALAAMAVCFRIFEPYAFAGTHLLDMRPNPSFVKDVGQWSAIFSGEADYPPSVQWAHTAPYLYPLVQMVQWGMGWPMGLLSVVGTLYWAVRAALWPRRYWGHALLIVWVALTFLYFGGQLAKAMRYFLAAYPAMAILGMGLLTEVGRLGSVRCGPVRGHWVSLGIAVLVAAATALYGIGFSTIYTRPLTRVAASDWIYEHVPRASVVANEHWDDPLPLRRPGRDPNWYKGITLELYNPDDASKLQKLVQALDQAQYIFLSSNRLYGSITKIPERWPLTTEYYRLLFSEELGFYKLAEFNSRPQLLGIQLVDDNAEELFTVYDHPKVIIFAKGSDYSAQKVRDLLSKVDLGKAMPIRPIQADKHGLMLPQDRLSPESGWSWSDLFAPWSLSNRLPLLSWLLVVELIGIVGWIWLHGIFGSLPDAGYGVAKTLGLVFVAYPAWLGASVGLIKFGPWSLWAVLAVLALGSALIVARHAGGLGKLLREKWKPLVLSEAVFLCGFALVTYIRACNPDLWHPIYGGEKPMDFAYFNAVLRSGWFPPYDPWFSGGYINYYYFGFVLAAVPTLLTGIVPWVAYNLMVPYVAGLLLAGSCTVGMGLSGSRRSFPLQALAGILAAAFVGLVGNLDGAVQVVQGLVALGGGGSSVPASALSLFRGVVAVASGKRLPTFDFWRSTRVIGPEDPGPITEFPYFTFLYGDLHAHMLALPLTVAAIGLACALVLRRHAGGFCGPWWAGPWGMPWSFLAQFVLVGGLVSGLLRATNTWDFPTYTLVLGLAFGIHQWLGLRRFDGAVLARTLVVTAGIAVSGALFVWPYLRQYELFYSGVDPVRAKTSVAHYVTIWGLFLTVVAVYGLQRTLARRAMSVRALEPQHAGNPGPLVAGRTDINLPTLLVSTATVVVAVTLGLLGYSVPALALLVSALLVVSLVAAGPSRVLASALALVALALTVLVEFVALKGDIGRMNTVFKFYLQAWVMLALASASFLGRHIYLAFRGFRGQGWNVAYLGLCGLLIAGALVYPLAGTSPRLSQRFQDLPLTLDGTAFMEVATYREKGVTFPLKDDLQAINWLLENVRGNPVMLEAPPGQLYRSWGSRISIYTGLPTVIGWDWHEKQQRWGYPGIVERRVADVRTLYDSPFPETKLALIKRYGVQYIYVGWIERLYYSADGLKAFENMVGQWLEVAYRAPGAVVYRVKLDSHN